MPADPFVTTTNRATAFKIKALVQKWQSLNRIKDIPIEDITDCFGFENLSEPSPDVVKKAVKIRSLAWQFAEQKKIDQFDVADMMPILEEPYGALDTPQVNLKSLPMGWKATPIKEHSGNKYLRQIVSAVDNKTSVEVDFYAICKACNVTSIPIAHALKKLLYAGVRNKGSLLQDLKEARDALDRAIEQESTNEQTV